MSKASKRTREYYLSRPYPCPFFTFCVLNSDPGSIWPFWLNTLALFCSKWSSSTFYDRVPPLTYRFLRMNAMKMV